MLPEYATVNEAAARLEIHPESVRRLLRQGRIWGVKVGETMWLINRTYLKWYASTYLNRAGYAPQRWMPHASTVEDLSG